MIAFDCALRRQNFSFDVAFEAQKGITALFGASGSGKSTAIRLLAGLARADRGFIRLNDGVLLDTVRKICAPPHRRRIGLVFQDALLSPHLSVKGNLCYGRWFAPKNDRKILFDPVVEMLGLGDLLQRRPVTLSGGERQRVAIGRALLAQPQLLLMDEPLASLDAARKLEILPFIERLRDEFAIPIVYVSHSVEEVARLAAHVVKLAGGRVIAAGTPAQTFGAISLAADERFEAVSILTARIDHILPDYNVTALKHPAGDIIAPGLLDPALGEISVAVRATNVTIARGAPGDISIRTILSGTIARIETDDSAFALATIALPGGDLLKAYTTRLAIDALGLRVGDGVRALVKSATFDERGAQKTVARDHARSKIAANP